MVKNRRCSVIGCEEEETFRSIAMERVEKAGLKVERSRRAYLCKKHYKEFKKMVKDEDRAKRWRWGL